MTEKIQLNQNGILRLHARNPWLFNKDLEEDRRELPRSGDLLPVASAKGEILGWAFPTPEVDTEARIFSFGNEKPDVRKLILQRLQNAADLRKRLLDPGLSCFRMVNSEGDFLPGLVVERYGSVVFVESQLAFWKQFEDALGQVLGRDLSGDQIVFSWKPVSDLVSKIEISEYGLRFEIALGKGQKTGHYCDQRENRRLLASVFRGNSVLDLFCYSGGFSLSLAGKAERIIAVDSSPQALALLKRNADLNGCSHVEPVQAKANDFFNTARDEVFDAVICDPPKLVKRRAEKQSGLKMYFGLNVQAMSRVRPGGTFMTFSCSGSVSKDEFFGLVASASRKLGRDLQIISHLSAGPDHPSLASLPETAYLKGLLLRIF